MPMLFAVPLTTSIADSTFVQFKSGNLILAISSNCAKVTEPTFCFCGSAAPFATPAAFFNKTEAGGVFTDFSGKEYDIFTRETLASSGNTEVHKLLLDAAGTTTTASAQR